MHLVSIVHVNMYCNKLVEVRLLYCYTLLSYANYDSSTVMTDDPICLGHAPCSSLRLATSVNVTQHDNLS